MPASSARTLAFLLSSLAALAAIPACAESAESTDVGEEDLTQNIVNLSFASPSYVNTLNTPTATLRPFRAAYFRIRIPATCGAVQIQGLNLQGRDSWGRWIPLSGVMNSWVADGFGGSVLTYTLNNGIPATVFAIGLAAYFPNFGTCTLAFEQTDGVGEMRPRSGYSFNGPETCPTPSPSPIACPAVVDPLERPCAEVGGTTFGCPGTCTTLCDRPVPPR